MPGRYRLTAIAAVAVVLGCGGVAVEHDPRARDPRAYVLGSGVARDYRRAATLYAHRCAEGCGDLTACRALFDLVVAERGMLPRVDHIPTLMRMCDRGDAVGCTAAMMLVGEDRVHPRRPRGSCESGDLASCEVDLWFVLEGGLSLPDDEPPPPAEREAKARDLGELRMTGTKSRLCGRGMTKACIRLVDSEMDAPSCTRAESKGEGCIAARSAELRGWGIDPAPLRAAWTRVVSACRDGDADACEQVPGREIPPRALCDAGDFAACADLALDGDRRAAAIACGAGMLALCSPPGPASGTVDQLLATLADLVTRCAKARDAGACESLETLTTPRACVKPPDRGSSARARQPGSSATTSAAQVLVQPDPALDRLR